jgi:hypothetical protein
MSESSKNAPSNMSNQSFEMSERNKNTPSNMSNQSFEMSERNKNTPSKMPNQFAKVKNTVKWEEEVQDETDHGYGFVDEFLEKALSTFNIFESQQGLDHYL